MTTKPYDQVTPAEIAQSDQTLAALANQAQAGSPVVVTLYPAPSDTCGQRDCDQAADYILCTLYGTPDRQDYKLCAGHYGHFAAEIAAIYRDVMGAES